jgi:hypothetical protein
MKVGEVWLRRLVGGLPMLTVLAGVSVGYSGCIWLALPSLAYQAYKYEHQSNSSSPASNPDPSSRDNTPLDHSIE